MTPSVAFLTILTVFSIIAGALARRHWGGWGRSHKIVRGVAFFGLGIAIAISGLSAVMPEGLSYQAAILGFFVGLIPQASLWFVKGHGFAHGMGHEAGLDSEGKRTITRPEGGTLPLCIVVFLGNYGAALALQGALLDAFEIGHHGFMVLFGLLTPLPHWLCWNVDFEKLLNIKPAPADQGHFYDGRTVIGELGLGAIMFGALPATLLLEQIIKGG